MSLLGVGGSGESRSTRSHARAGRLLRRYASNRGGSALFLGLTIANLANFGFHVGISRLLAPSSYGAVAALLAVVLVLTVPLNAVQVAVARDAVLATERGRPVSIRPFVSASAVLGLAAFVLTAFASPLTENFLHLATPWPMIVLGLFLVPSVIEVGPRGLLIAERQFVPVAVALVAGSAVRLASAVVLVALGGGVTGALASTAIGESVTAIMMLVAARPWLARPSETRPALRVASADIVRSIVAFAGYWSFISADTVLARHYLNQTASGVYGAAATAARAALFAPAAVALVVFPTFAKHRGGPEAALP